MLLDYCRDCFRIEVSSRIKKCPLPDFWKIQNSEKSSWETYLSPRSLLALQKSESCKDIEKNGDIISKSIVFDYAVLKLSYDSYINGYQISPFTSVTVVLQGFVIPKLKKYDDAYFLKVRTDPFV